MTTESTSADDATRRDGSALSEGLGAASEARSYPACKGRNCGCTDGVNHSPQCKQDHADASAGIVGRCSVPMWMNGCPAGTCDKPSFGKRPPSKTWWNYAANERMREDGRYNGYVPGLACYEHGGPKSA